MGRMANLLLVIAVMLTVATGPGWVQAQIGAPPAAPEVNKLSPSERRRKVLREHYRSNIDVIGRVLHGGDQADLHFAPRTFSYSCSVRRAVSSQANFARQRSRRWP